MCGMDHINCPPGYMEPILHMNECIDRPTCPRALLTLLVLRGARNTYMCSLFEYDLLHGQAITRPKLTLPGLPMSFRYNDPGA